MNDWGKALALRASSFSMGFVFFAGAWRRFYNAPAKLDVNSVHFLGNKLVGAAPGSPIESVVHWVLARPAIADFATHALTLGEGLAGLGLMLGALTRISALGAALLNIALMLIFGWQGYECLDEWTMAALGFAISVSVMVYGPSIYSLDNIVGLDVLRSLFTRPVAIGLTVFSILFTVSFYAYYFGFWNLERRTGVSAYRIVAEAGPSADIATLYVNAGASPNAAYVRSIAYHLKDGREVVQQADEIEVVRSHFEPWSQSGSVADEVLLLRLGSKTDIRIPAGTASATIDLIGNEDQTVTFE
ncbi:TQO small subunit DoxD [Methyloligella halotolerans]|nr:TQO small subunit DoxD [Methyloligella halotolerans]